LSDGDPVSWLLIERGWAVVGPDGSEIGKVVDVIGDSGKDIFDGLSVSSGLLGKPRYLAAERVGSIEEGRVHVDVDDPAHLGEYEEPPPSEAIVPERASWWDRLRGAFRGD